MPGRSFFPLSRRTAAAALALALVALPSNHMRAGEPAQLPVGDRKVTSLAFSPDGKRATIATGDSGDAVFLYELTTAAAVKLAPAFK